MLFLAQGCYYICLPKMFRHSAERTFLQLLKGRNPTRKWTHICCIKLSYIILLCLNCVFKLGKTLMKILVTSQEEIIPFWDYSLETLLGNSTGFGLNV